MPRYGRQKVPTLEGHAEYDPDKIHSRICCGVSISGVFMISIATRDTAFTRRRTMYRYECFCFYQTASLSTSPTISPDTRRTFPVNLALLICPSLQLHKISIPRDDTRLADLSPLRLTLSEPEKKTFSRSRGRAYIHYPTIVRMERKSDELLTYCNKSHQRSQTQYR